MNKKALTEAVRDIILKKEAVADNQRVAHFKRVEQIVGYAFDTLLAQMQMNEGGEREIESYFVKHYYNQAVLESNGYRYIGLSDEIAPLDDGRGIWYVKPSGGAKTFSHYRRPAMSLFSSLPMGVAMNETMFRVGNVTNTSQWQIILEDTNKSALTDVRKVDYGIVRTFSSYSDTEKIRLPDGRYDLLIQMSVEAFGLRENDSINNDK